MLQYSSTSIVYASCVLEAPLQSSVLLYQHLYSSTHCLSLRDYTPLCFFKHSRLFSTPVYSWRGSLPYSLFSHVILLCSFFLRQGGLWLSQASLTAETYGIFIGCHMWLAEQESHNHRVTKKMECVLVAGKARGRSTGLPVNNRGKKGRVFAEGNIQHPCCDRWVGWTTEESERLAFR